MGCLCLTLREEPLAPPCISESEPSLNPSRLATNEGSRDPALPHLRGGVLVLSANWS
jgi:hypothetical protein